MAVTSYSRRKFYPEYIGRCWGPCSGTNQTAEPARPYQVRWFVHANPSTPGVTILQADDLGINLPWIPRQSGSDPDNALITQSWVRYCKLAISEDGYEFITTWDVGAGTVTVYWSDGSDQSDSWSGSYPLPFYNGLLDNSGTKEVVVYYLKPGVDATKIYMRRESDAFASESELQTGLDLNLAKLLEVDTGAFKPNRTTMSLWAEDDNGQLVEFESDGYSGDQSTGDYWYSPNCGQHEDNLALTTTLEEIGYEGFVDVGTLMATFEEITYTQTIFSSSPAADVATLSATFEEITHALGIISSSLDADVATMTTTFDEIDYVQAVFSTSPSADEGTLTATFDEITYTEVTEDSGGPHIDVTTLTATFDEITYQTP